MTNVRSLYERLGGEEAVMAAVDRFYEKVTADELVSPFFRGLELTAQIQKQIGFMSSAFGGPVAHRGRDLREAHAALVRDRGLSHVHFDRVAQLLEQSLVELDIPPPLVGEVMKLVGSLRPQVLGEAT